MVKVDHLIKAFPTMFKVAPLAHFKSVRPLYGRSKVDIVFTYYILQIKARLTSGSCSSGLFSIGDSTGDCSVTSLGTVVVVLTTERNQLMELYHY